MVVIRWNTRVPSRAYIFLADRYSSIMRAEIISKLYLTGAIQGFCPRSSVFRAAIALHCKVVQTTVLDKFRGEWIADVGRASSSNTVLLLLPLG